MDDKNMLEEIISDEGEKSQDKNMVEEIFSDEGKKGQDKNIKIISSNEKFFKFYVYLPRISTIITAILVLIWSIVDPLTFRTYNGYYGIMRLHSVVGCMIVWWAIGFFVCLFHYLFIKILLAPKILEIYYLKSISEELKSKN